jgi:putative phosphoesterase
MLIGILSDTHNNLQNLQSALDRMRNEGISTVIHCGDLTGVEVARAMHGFRVICAFGNGDTASGDIRQVLIEMDPENYAGLVYRGKIGGARIAVTHGHLPGYVDELVRSGEFDYVFKGHSHQHKEEIIGHTRLINPGALGGLRPEERRFCLLDLESRKANFVSLKT